MSSIESNSRSHNPRKLAAVIPVAPRPERINSFLTHLYQLEGIELIDIYLAADRDNSQLDEIGKVFSEVTLIKSEHNSHLYTLNNTIRSLATRYDYIFYFNDDMFPEENFVSKSVDMIEKLESQLPDKVFSFYFRDGHQNEKLSTTFCVSKDYIKLLGGKIYQDQYFHGYYADQEFFKIGKKIKRLFYCDHIFVRHDHFELKDEINELNESASWQLDKKIYRLRKKIGFNIAELKFRLLNISNIQY